MYFLGISPAHDSSICLYNNGEIKYFCKEERLTRKKRDSHPVNSIKEIDPHPDLEAIAWCPPIRDDLYREKFFIDAYNNKIPCKNVIDFSEEHHLVHASLAFYNSGFKEAAVIVIDRNGSDLLNSCREAESIFVANYPYDFKAIYKSFWIYDNFAHEAGKIYQKDHPDCEVDVRSMFGIVKVYESATTLINQHALENGKTMGLSSYGEKNNFPPLFANNNIPNDFYFGHRQLYENRSSTNQELDYLNTSDLTEKNYKLYANYAKHVQNETERAVCSLIEKVINKTGIKNICITGGYALNVVANKYFLDQFPGINFYFEPLADDSGNSIGGAMFLYRTFTEDKKIYKIKNTFFNGKKHKLDSINGAYANAESVAKLLNVGKTIAVYNGISEAGPRALGNRSILLDPRIKNGKNLINKIKNREWYRPFAASILNEDANKYFYMTNMPASPYMTAAFDAREGVIDLFPSIVHVDNTCRVQTVDKDIKHFYELLTEFKKLTGVGILLNTSFNLSGEPLVETPEDAINTLKNSDLDYVWFVDKNLLVSKEDTLL